MKFILRTALRAVTVARCLRGIGVALALMSLVPTPGAAQQADWSLWVAPQITRSLDEDGGPDLGAVGASLQLVRGSGPGGWSWGGAATLHRLGTFTAPDVPDRTNRTFALGVRALRTDASGRWFLNLGGDLMSVEERVEGGGDAGWSRDPGVGVYVGAGWSGQGTQGGPGFFIESGLTGALATGENTAGGGVYLSLKAGIAL